MRLPTLQILVCTIDARFLEAVKVPLQPIPGVEYLISWQRTMDSELPIPPEIQERKDIQVHITRSCGLSRNRNHALSLASGDYLLMADDDERFRETELLGLREWLATHPQWDICLFQTLRTNGQPAKNYPQAAFAYPQVPRGYYPSSCEIVVQRASLPHLPQFDTRFGLGAEWLACGEEEVFLYQAARQGAKITYFPLVIAMVPQVTTGDLFTQESRVRRSKGAVLCVMHGPISATLRCVKFALVQSWNWKNTWRYLKDMIEGIRYISSHP